jgi:transposase
MGAVWREVTRQGGQRTCLRIVRLLFAALADHAGVLAHRPGALERVQLLLEDWHETRQRLADTEARMTSVLDELHLSELATCITDLSGCGAPSTTPRRTRLRLRSSPGSSPSPPH